MNGGESRVASGGDGTQMRAQQPVHPGRTRRELCLSPAQHAGYTAREIELLARGVFRRACDATRQGERLAHWVLGVAALVGVPVILWVAWHW